MKSLFLAFSSLASVFLLVCIQAAPLDDLVTHLPDYGPPSTTHFSGYLDATAGCDTEADGSFCKIHYWSAMAEVEDPMSAPVVLWLVSFIFCRTFVS